MLHYNMLYIIAVADVPAAFAEQNSYYPYEEFTGLAETMLAQNS